MSAHTPGPWIIKPGAALPQYDGTPLQVTANNRYIAKVDAVTGGDYLKDQNSANARLIAAAPAMLEALKGLLENAPIPKGVKQDFRYILYREAASKAIRLAEGMG